MDHSITSTTSGGSTAIDPSRSTPEDVPVAKRSEDVPMAKQSEDVPVAKRSEDVSMGKRSEDVPVAKRSKTIRKVSVLPLHKRQFYHSHTGQPMTHDEVMGDEDSENELDDETTRLDASQMFADDSMGNDEVVEKFIELWNYFVEKQRVLADAHIPWACLSFSRLYIKELRLNSAFYSCWRSFMINQCKHGLVDAKTVTKCNEIIQNDDQCNSLDIVTGMNNNNVEDMDLDDNNHDDKESEDKEPTQVFAPDSTEATQDFVTAPVSTEPTQDIVPAPVPAEATMHVAGTDPTDRNEGENETDERVEDVETESSHVVETPTFLQRGKGKRKIKPSQKMKELKKPIGPKTRGPRGRGRGHGRGRNSLDDYGYFT